MLNPSGVSWTRMKLGLLMATAQSDQKIVQWLFETLKEHTERLDAVVRDEIRQVSRVTLRSSITRCASRFASLRLQVGQRTELPRVKEPWPRSLFGQFVAGIIERT